MVEDRPAGTVTQPSAQPSATHLPAAPDGYVWTFDPDGTPIMLPEHARAAKEAAYGLVAEPYDVEASTNAWQAAHNAAADIILQSIDEFQRDGMVRPETFTAISMAGGAWIDSFKRLMRDVGGVFPSEQHVKDMAAAKQARGDLKAYPNWRRHEAVVDAYVANTQTAPTQE